MEQLLLTADQRDHYVQRIYHVMELVGDCGSMCRETAAASEPWKGAAADALRSKLEEFALICEKTGNELAEAKKIISGIDTDAELI